jgi:hypothetical protein
MDALHPCKIALVFSLCKSLDAKELHLEDVLFANQGKTLFSYILHFKFFIQTMFGLGDFSRSTN